MHSQILGTGIEKAFPTFRNRNGNEKLIPKRWERESEARIPENGGEREFPLIPDLQKKLHKYIRHIPDISQICLVLKIKLHLKSLFATVSTSTNLGFAGLFISLVRKVFNRTEGIYKGYIGSLA